MSFVGAGIGSTPSMLKRGDGDEFLSFAGTDYLGLARHPEVRAAAIAAVERFGVGSGASRRTTGTSEIHVALESAFADFKRRPSACILSSGYLAPRALFEALNPKDAVVFVDEGAHPALLAALPNGIATVGFRHFDIGHLEERIAAAPVASRRIVCFDSVDLFGDVAPIAEVAALGIDDLTIVCDDAHGVGILGPTGRGIEDGIDAERISLLTTNSLSKAIGSSGGAVAGDKALIDRMRTVSLAYGGATALPNALAAAALASLVIIRREPERRSRCLASAESLAASLRTLGYPIEQKRMPVVTSPVFGDDAAIRLAAALEAGGILASCGTYPSENGRRFLRFVVTAEHSTDDLERLVDLMRKIG